MAQPYWGARGLASKIWLSESYQPKSYNPGATGSLRHFMLKVFCANLKIVPFSINSSTFYPCTLTSARTRGTDRPGHSTPGCWRWWWPRRGRALSWASWSTRTPRRSPSLSQTFGYLACLKKLDIIHKSFEWMSSLVTHFIDFQKHYRTICTPFHLS